MKIYAAGLPRTGTTSLSKGLEILGYKVAHYCPITNADTLDQLDDSTQEAYVSSELLLRADVSHGKWILLHREKWYESMWNLGLDLCEWQKHMDKWKALKTVKQDNVLHYSVTQGWKPLCEFLGKPIPKQPFPIENTRQTVLA